eukprot:2187335-Pyramimonas_sp.AAC.1
MRASIAHLGLELEAGASGAAATAATAAAGARAGCASSSAFAACGPADAGRREAPSAPLVHPHGLEG